MMNDRFTITFKTSADAESKLANEAIDTTTTIIFTGWSEEDLKAAAAETVKIRQIQPRIRKGETIGTEFIASRPGTRAAVDPMSAMIGKFGSVEAAIQALQEISRRKNINSATANQ
jgi:hypothetical protein